MHHPCSRSVWWRISLGLSLALLMNSLPLALLTPTASAQEYIPPDRGIPGRRQGAGTRGCWDVAATPESSAALAAAISAADDAELPTALVPSQNFGYTLSAYPSFFFYIPSLYAGRSISADFTLVDDQGQEVYSTTFQTNNSSGVIRLSLPTTANVAPLEVGKDYHWVFGLTCNLTDRSADRVMDGVIQRIAPSADLQAMLQAATPTELPALYARAGVWYDAVASVANLRSQADPTFPQQWQALLNSVDLGYIRDESWRSSSLGGDRSLPAHQSLPAIQPTDGSN
jgi:Domain of Unknown Function (DUF928)